MVIYLGVEQSSNGDNYIIILKPLLQSKCILFTQILYFFRVSLVGANPSAHHTSSPPFSIPSTYLNMINLLQDYSRKGTQGEKYVFHFIMCFMSSLSLCLVIVSTPQLLRHINASMCHFCFSFIFSLAPHSSYIYMRVEDFLF